MRFSMILQMVDRFTGPGRRARSTVERLRSSSQRMGRQMQRTARDVRSGNRSIRELGRSAGRASLRALSRGAEAAGRSIRTLGRHVARLERRLDLAGRAGRGLGRGLRRLGGMAVGALQMAGAAGLAGGGFALFDLFRTAGQFEQFQVMLEGIEGSAAAARRSIKWVQDFTQKTPFELDQVMEGFVALKAYGIEPTEGSLETLGDTAAGMSKPLMQAVEMMADAMTGEFERLKEFGIRARVEGNKVTFSYRKNGKDIQRTAENTGSAIEAALTGILSDRFEGAMERQSKTLFGIISNLKDMWTNFLILIADAGIFDVVKQDLEDLYANVQAMAKDGRLKQWAEEISDRLKEAWEMAVKFIESDWEQVLADLQKIGKAAMVIADAVITIAEFWNSFEGKGPEGAVSDWLWGDGKKKQGLGQRMFGGLFGGGEPPAPPSAPATGTGSGSIGINRLRSYKGSSAAGARGGDVGGRIELDVRAAPGISVRPRKVAASAVPITVRTGRAMRGAA